MVEILLIDSTEEEPSIPEAEKISTNQAAQMLAKKLGKEFRSKRSIAYKIITEEPLGYHLYIGMRFERHRFSPEMTVTMGLYHSINFAINDKTNKICHEPVPSYAHHIDGFGLEDIPELQLAGSCILAKKTEVKLVIERIVAHYTLIERLLIDLWNSRWNLNNNGVVDYVKRSTEYSSSIGKFSIAYMLHYYGFFKEAVSLYQQSNTILCKWYSREISTLIQIARENQFLPVAQIYDKIDKN